MRLCTKQRLNLLRTAVQYHLTATGIRHSTDVLISSYYHLNCAGMDDKHKYFRVLWIRERVLLYDIYHEDHSPSTTAFGNYGNRCLEHQYYRLNNAVDWLHDNCCPKRAGVTIRLLYSPFSRGQWRQHPNVLHYIHSGSVEPSCNSILSEYYRECFGNE